MFYPQVITLCQNVLIFNVVFDLQEKNPTALKTSQLMKMLLKLKNRLRLTGCAIYVNFLMH